MKLETSRNYYIYIMTNLAKDAFETGVTGDLVLRMQNPQTATAPESVTHSQDCTFLVYWEQCIDGLDAINREKQIRSYSRKKKADLIDMQNPEWKFLNESICNLSAHQL